MHFHERTQIIIRTDAHTAADIIVNMLLTFWNLDVLIKHSYIQAWPRAFCYEIECLPPLSIIITSREARFACPLLYPSIVPLYVKHPICSNYTIIACRIFKGTGQHGSHGSQDRPLPGFQNNIIPFEHAHLSHPVMSQSAVQETR